MNEAERCPWSLSDERMMKYHDEEWGVPLHDDIRLFEFLVLDIFQAGLSWRTILHKRENFRKAFHNFDFSKIASYNKKKTDELLLNSGIVRNRSKVEATIHNAKCMLDLVEKRGSFDKYLWSYVDRKPIVNNYRTYNEIPGHTSLSDQISADLRKEGFIFVGSTIIYSFLQASGVVNDHIITCFRHREIQKRHYEK
ncbi:MAG TPA: DNA-3-methyladenine glycosylase I [Bacteroidales bacterium]|jgi:DNA-3-methyladenine glycosylase I|nr:DNA-3-methyladenine glycosylase I [Bacteroidales bacterium]MDI9574616.1 DNA-3-methyladenine glycosylase I [Bacteroidota bacterium]OQC59515.1 MAG: DNA-3-methyladenine glycosylase 1 [Bacteroidetes bacterium ADurb.Bin012]MBP9512108.1 DNA-3-methyladenine glycosylase I [Bacteroidales bacterium]MBP9588653.1 DNA-3-methyladenine glycosylase I [Bacteroidales bacterium]